MKKVFVVIVSVLILSVSVALAGNGDLTVYGNLSVGGATTLGSNSNNTNPGTLFYDSSTSSIKGIDTEQFDAIPIGSRGVDSLFLLPDNKQSKNAVKTTDTGVDAYL